MNNKLPLLSVIIPYYNHNAYIKQTLDSIASDTYSHKEIIIINDGSTDPDDSNLVQWINSHNEISVKYIKRENRGLTKTLNELIDLSNGKYICVCASDDYLINNTLTKRIQILEQNPKKMILISDNIVVDDDSKLLYNSNLFEMRKGVKNNYKTDLGLKYELIRRWGLAGACYIAKKDVYQLIGKYDEMLIVEDWDFFLRAVAKDLIAFYDEKVSAYRLHSNNTISNTTKKEKMLLDRANTAKNNIKNFHSPYFKYLLWKIYQKTVSGLK